MNRQRFAVFAWAVLAFNLAVILWGAVVRATGSGAGCGAHWPRCNGEVVPLAPTTETVIEFAHRATSGLALIGVVAMAVLAFRLFPRTHRVRKAALASVGIIFVEAGIGAILVLFGWVGDDASTGRIVTIPIHLVNTLLLIGAIALTAWWAGGRPGIRASRDPRTTLQLGAGLVGVAVVAAAGAITALGDTLFPSTSLGDGLRQDFSGTSEFLVRLRVIHPVLAIAVGFFLVVVARRFLDGRRREIRLAAGAVIGLVVVQLLAGIVNVVLLAPIWMQILHLFLADALWLALVLLTAAVLADETAGVERAEAAEART